jgi:phage gp46-like protein
VTVTSRRDYGWITDRIRDTAVQAVLTGIEAGLSLSAACAEVAVDLEVHANTVKNWVMQSGQLEQVRSSNDSQIVARLAAEISVVRAANTGLLAALKHRQGQK